MPVNIECSRTIPVLEALAGRYPDLPLSIDTVHAATADAAIGAGACIVNDVTAGRHDPALISVAVRHAAGLVLSHSRGPLGTLASYDAAEYDGDVAGGVAREGAAALRAEIARHLADEGRGERLRDGLAVAIVGAPNAGKSSLINALSGRDVAIGSEHAGTTRDLIELPLEQELRRRIIDA